MDEDGGGRGDPDSAGAGTTPTSITATGLTTTARFVIIALALTGAAAWVGGYAAYQHYDCGAFWGSPSASVVLHHAMQRFHDTSFKYAFKGGDGTRSKGEFDDRNLVGDEQVTLVTDTTMFEHENFSKGQTVYIVYDHDELYYRTSKKADWTSQTILRADPFPHMDYLASARGVTQSDCDFHGTTSDGLPFEASINPDGYVTHVTTGTPNARNETTYFDYGVPITVPV